jgi:hypothetical protein
MLNVIQLFTCDICGAQESLHSGELPMFNVVQKTMLPNAEWRWVGQNLVCPRHDVLIKMKLPPKETEGTDDGESEILSIETGRQTQRCGPATGDDEKGPRPAG